MKIMKNWLKSTIQQMFFTGSEEKTFHDFAMSVHCVFQFLIWEIFVNVSDKD